MGGEHKERYRRDQYKVGEKEVADPGGAHGEI